MYQFFYEQRSNTVANSTDNKFIIKFIKFISLLQNYDS